VDALPHDRRALQIGPDGQRTCALEFTDGGVEIELADATHDQPSVARLAGDTSQPARREGA